MKLIIVFFLFYLQYFTVVLRETKICRVYNIEQCKRTNNSCVDVKEFRIYNPAAASTVFYLEADVVRDIPTDPNVRSTIYIPGGPSLEIKVLKCIARESPDTCEIFTTLRPSNPCMFMFMKNMMWSNFVENIEPKASCRAKKGHYILKNATLDPELFQVFPIAGYNWKIELKFFTAVDEYMTICVDAQILTIHV